MLRIIQSTSASSAATYYSEGLKREDYYSQGHEVTGRWHGLALEKLGLAAGSAVEPEGFTALLENRHPVTGKRITARQNSIEGRIPYWDFNFHAPKSLSLLHAITRDEALVQAFRESVTETMAAIEARIATRVRLGGRQEDRVTGNGIWAEFMHYTSRPVDGLPDCHMHCHAVTLNLTMDVTENRWKAAKIREIKSNAYLYEAQFHSLLTEKLVGLGYAIERTAKGWEIAGLNDANLLRKFSRRTAEVEKLAKQLGITDAKGKDVLGATTRSRKQKNLTQADLLKEWKSRLTPQEAAAVERTHARKGPSPFPKVTVGEALDFAEAKVFERNSVVEKNRVLAAALRFGVGSVTLDQAKHEMERRRFIEREIDGVVKVTTRARVLEEVELLARVRAGLDRHAPLIKGRLHFIQDFLSKEQREAVRHILKSHDQVIALRGKAGTGKTTLLTEVRQQLEREGTRMIALSVTGDASRGVLRSEGFQGADTVARFLVSQELQSKARGHVILVDEAGLLPQADIRKLLDIAGDSTRIILSGDTGQHAPVGRGDAMRLLEQYAGLPIATVRQIRRQEEEGYRKAVEAMSERDLKTGFVHLDDINAIHEIPQDELRFQRLAHDYAQCLAETGVPPLVVSPTHAEGRMAIGAIRTQLREVGLLGPERQFLQYRQLKWEAAEKLLAENYERGQMVQFHQNVPDIKRGSILPVLKVDAGKTVWLESPAGQRIPLDLSRSEHFRVFEIGDIALSAGDRLKITHGGKDLNGRRLENGTLSTVKTIGKDGRITLANGLLLDSKFGHFAHGYDTSHSSQGKTAREVFVAQSSTSFKASSSEQFYVSISRGRERLRIYTDDRTKLQNAVGNTARRLSAMEFTGLGDLFMNGGLSGTEWTRRIADGKASRQEHLKGHVDKLLAQRKVDPPQEKIFSYRDYLDMRRANLTLDGKSRSKGHPDAAKANNRSRKGMVPDPRGNQKSSAGIEVKPQVSAEPKAKKDPALKQAGNALKTSSQHLKEVVGRTRRGADSLIAGAKRSIQFGNLKTTVGKLTGNPKTQAAQTKHQATQKPPAPKPPTPAPTLRRGR